jgi:pimeloyl-ACP methyl ester carboxylesterase
LETISSIDEDASSAAEACALAPFDTCVDAVAIDWLAERPDFDGKHLVVYGSSQGGWFAFIMAALNPHVTAIAANVPAGCDRIFFADYVGPKGVSLSSEQARQYAQTYAYYDSVNFARRIRPSVPALVSAGFRDTTCPPGITPNYTCAYQGLTAGCGDLYGPTLGCQYLDVTGVAPGNYTLRVTVDPFERVIESREDNNVAEVPVTLP